jgi:tetratricopeptide (TPR) repeat protein
MRISNEIGHPVLAATLFSIAACLVSTAAAEQTTQRARKTPRPTVTAMQAQARKVAQSGQYQKSAVVLRQALLWAPNSTELLYDYGVVELHLGAPVETVRALRAATRLEADNAQYLYVLGLAHLWTGDLDSGSVVLRRVTELEPQKAAAHLALAVALHDQKKFDESSLALDRVLALDPGNTEGLYLLSDIAQNRGDLDRAALLARRALERRPGHPGANLVLGIAMMKQEKWADARNALESAAAADPGSPRVQYQLSILYSRLDEPEKASEARRKYEVAAKKTQTDRTALRKLLEGSNPKDDQ